jgi:tape measure domain-containing protein
MSANVGSIDYTVRFDISQLLAGQQRIGQSLNATANIFNNTTNNINGNVTNITNNINNMGNAAQNAGSSLNAMGAIKMVALAYAIKNIGNELIEVQISVDRLNNSLKFSNEGNVVAASRELQYLKEKSEELGLNFQETSASFARFSSAAKASGIVAGDVRLIFEAVSQDAAALGISNDAAGRAFVALTQMMGKGVVMAEEWKGQLAEALPNATGVMLKALGKTNAEFTDMIATGKIGTDELRIFAKVMREDTAQAAQDASKSMLAATNRMGNAWFEFKTIVVESGVGDLIKFSLERATDAVRNFTQTLALAKKEGGGFGATSEAIGKGLVNWVNPWSGKPMTDMENMTKLTQEAKNREQDYQRVKAAGNTVLLESAKRIRDEANAKRDSFAGNMPKTQSKAELDAISAAEKKQNDQTTLDKARSKFKKDYKTKALKDAEELKNFDEAATKAGFAKGSPEYQQGLAALNEGNKSKKTPKSKLPQQEERGYQELLRLRSAAAEGIVKIDMQEADEIDKISKLKFKSVSEYEEAKSLVAKKYAQDRMVFLEKESDKEVAIQEKAQAEMLADQQRVASNKAAFRALDPVKALQDQYDAQLAVVAQYETDAAQIGVDVHTEAMATRALIDQEYNTSKQALALQTWAKESEINQFTLDALDSFAQASTAAIGGLLTGTMSASEAMRSLASSIMNEAVSALVQMGVTYVKNSIIQETVDNTRKAAGAAAMSAAASGQVAMMSSMAAMNAFAATAAIPIVGPAAAPAAAAAAGAMAASLGAASVAAAPIAGARRYGGAAEAGSMYRVNESGAPEMYTANNGNQYMMATANGNVTPANELGGGSGVTINISNYTGADVQATTSPDGKMIEIAVRQAVQAVGEGLRSNTGPAWDGLKAGSNTQSKL